MAMASPRTQEHEEIELEALDVDPHFLVNRDHVSNESQEPFDIRAQANTYYSTANVPQAQTRTTTLPEERNVDISCYLPLFRAILNGHWKRAKAFFQRHPDAWTAIITDRSQTALMVAASAGRSEFVKRMVEQMPAEALAMQDADGFTALHLAAISGITKAAKALARRNPALTQIMNKEKDMPLHSSVISPNKEMLWFLSTATTDEPPGSPFTGPSAASLIYKITRTGFHDVVLYLLHRYPNLATVRDDQNNSVLRMLAEDPSAFQSGSRLGFWSRCIYPFVPVKLNPTTPHLLGGDMEDPPGNLRDLADLPILIRSGICLKQVLQWANRLLRKVLARAPGIKQVRDEKLRHEQATELVEHVCRQLLEMSRSQIIEFFINQAILTTATSNGIVEIVMRCLQHFPDLIGHRIENGPTIYHVAVAHRQEKIFSLLREKTARDLLYSGHWVEGNTISHLAAKLPPSPRLKCVSGSALQLQRELLWFKEVENFHGHHFQHVKNKDHKIPWELFMDEHEKLLEKGEKWMKDTSSSCMVVATLIATIVFAAAFTVPGGNESNDGKEVKKGIPIFLRRNSFLVFAVSDALALFSASTSILMFLSILTARYAEEDFLVSLPKRLIIGLASLFFAIATMMIAFSAALSIILGERLKWAYIQIASMASFPVILFVLLQLPLFIQMVKFTCPARLFRRPSNLRI